MLASLARRATTIETGLFEMQATNFVNSGSPRQVQPDERKIVYAMFARTDAVDAHPDRATWSSLMCAVSTITMILTFGEEIVRQ
jgi:hypothetical protein